MIQPDAENGCQHRSRLDKILNVPRLGIELFRQLGAGGVGMLRLRYLSRLRPCLWNGASRRAGVGGGEKTAFLSIHREDSNGIWAYIEFAAAAK
jgi:hypothetical protein